MKIFFAATTPFAVNAFLKSHLLALLRDYEVVLLVNTKAYPLAGEISAGVRVVNIEFARKISPWRDMICFLELFLLFLQERPDAVHSIMPKSGMLAMAAAFLTLIPRRYHTFTGQVWANKSGWRRGILKFFDRMIVVMTTKVLADSPSQAKFIEAEGLAATGQVLVLGEGSIAGVDPKRFTSDEAIKKLVRSQLHTKNDTCVFLFVGRITKDKGIFDLLDVFSKIVQQNPQCALWIVGPDDEGIGAKWMAEHLEDASGVHWLGATDAPERFMAAADILVLPSYREGFGLVIIEAASCGAPAIAYRIDGVIDSVADGSTGVLVTTGDLSALASEMLSLSKDHARRQQLGENARTRATTNYSSTAITAQWVNFYEGEFSD